jgi:hypothetical protein
MTNQITAVLNNGTANFSTSYAMQFPTFIQPTIVTAITNLNLNTTNATANNVTFAGCIVPSITPNLLGNLVTLSIQGTGWNESVYAITISVSMLENSTSSYQSVMLNLTNINTSVAVDPHYNNTNCKIQMFLMGWQNIQASKFANCSLVTAGNLTCAFNFDANTSAFLYYNIFIIDNQWYSINCVGCSIGYINASNNYQPFNKVQSASFRYFYGFKYISNIDTWVAAINLPASFSLAIGTLTYDSYITIVMLPPFETQNTTNTTNTTITTTIQKLSAGAIAGIVIGAVAGVALISVIIYFIKKKRDEIKNEQVNEDVRSDRTEPGVCQHCCANPVVKIVPCGHQVYC